MTGTGHSNVLLFGLRIRSEIPLSGLPSTDSCADLVISVDAECEEAASQVLPVGEVLAEFVDGDFRVYTAVVWIDGSYLLRIHSVCDVHIDATLSRMRVAPAPGMTADLMSIVLSGTVMSFVLSLRGAYVLHGSAVTMDSETLAFVNRSGGGKSTLAAQFCAAGAQLVTDDVLPLAVNSGVHIVGRGGELRLREAAWDVLDWFAVEPNSRETADRRLAVRPDMSDVEVAPLDRIVLPVRSRDASSLTVERLELGDAVFSLLLHPRIVTWLDEATVTRHFQMATRVAATVPVYRAVIPWGPPFSMDTPGRMLEILRRT
jgi:hypothetical protein